jgi:predicted RecB family nuclease
MKITHEILESYLNCKTKGHLKLAGESGTKSDYEAMTTAASQDSREAALAKLVVRFGDGDACRGVRVTSAMLKQGAPLLADAELEDNVMSIRFDALKRADGASMLGDHHYLPVLHNPGDKVDRPQRLLLAVLGLSLASVQGLRPNVGLMASGREAKLRKVRLDAKLYQQAEQVLNDVMRLQENSDPPPLMLNRHCQICEYCQRCRAEAVEKDDLSLLGDVGEKELRRYNRKGIFTVTQLSCTFRARRKGKRVKRPGTTRYAALHALAIREKKVHVYGTPDLPRKPVRLFFDAEGVEGGHFMYLLGVLVVDGDEQKMHSFWADGVEQEEQMFDAFLDLLEGYQDFAMFHYGSYEKALLRRIRKVVKRKDLVDRAVNNAVNVLSAIHAHVYFPVFSNGLKDVGRYLDCTWTAEDASGLQSLVWRARWEQSGEVVWKDKLLAYNADDCAALRKVTECVQAIGEAARVRGVEASSAPSGPPVAWADEVGRLSNRREYCRVKFSLPDFDHVNQCAFFDYQREKVFLRTSKVVRRACMNRRKRRPRLRASREIELRDDVCPVCQGARITRLPEKTCGKIALDLDYSQGGIRRRVILCTAFWHWCEDCQKRFQPERHQRRDKHLHGLKSWAMSQHVVHRVNLSHLQGMFEECFGVSISREELRKIRSLMASRYRKTCERILARIVGGGVAHADESEVDLQKETGYVWVLANLEDVLYLYKPSREAVFLHELLKDFKGVLVSDFYSGYDSLECPQQKCLIHLIRDFNADLMGNPYDEEIKTLAAEFGRLLRPIVETIDKHGLKKGHLQQHKSEVSLFFRGLEARSYRSEVADAYQTRLARNEGKLFTFLDHEGVPWNNNSAEHAIKALAYFRRNTDGLMREEGLSDYLVLLSVQQTCKYRGVSFLEFLLSQEEDVEAYCQRVRRKNPPATIEVYPEGFSRTLRKQPSDHDAANGGERSERIGHWRLAVLTYLSGRAESGAYFHEIADHCVGLIRGGTLVTAVSGDDRRRVDQSLAQFLNGRKKAGELDQASDKLFRITVRGLAWLERTSRRS